MNRKALILEVRSRDVLILTEDHEYQVIVRKTGYAVGQTIQVDPSDLKQLNQQREGINMKKKWITAAASLILVAAVAIVAVVLGTNPAGQPEVSETRAESISVMTEKAPSSALAQKPIVAVLAIDINPSIELLLDEDGIVVDYNAMNPDAEQLPLEGILGLSAEEAIEQVIVAAESAGFINYEDQAADYVVLAVAPMEDADETFEPLYLKIQERLRNRIIDQERLQDLEMIMLRTTEQIRLQAHKSEVGLGLHILNQAAVQAGLDDANSVREYFTNQERLQLAEQIGFIWQSKYQGSNEGTGQGTQEQGRETSGSAPFGETSGSGQGTGQANQGETSGSAQNGKRS